MAGIEGQVLCPRRGDDDKKKKKKNYELDSLLIKFHFKIK